MKVIPLLFLMAGVAMFCSCDHGASDRIDTRHFQKPDSVRSSLTISVFESEDGSAISLLVFPDSVHSRPRRITYFENGTVQSEELQEESEGVYRSMRSGPYGLARYVVENKVVYASYCGVSPHCISMNQVTE